MTQSIGSTSRPSTISGAPPAPDDASATTDTAASLLPEPSSSAMLDGDPGSQIEALVLSSAAEDRNTARTMRDQEEALARSAEESQLHEMQRRADKAYAAGLVGGVATAASGGMMLVGACFADEKAGKRLDGGAKVVEGGGKVGSAVLQAASDAANIEATQQEQLAGRFHRGADDQRDGMKAARDLADQAVSFYKDYVAAKNEAQKATLFRA